MVPCTHDEARVAGSAYCGRCGAQFASPQPPPGYPPYQGHPPQAAYPPQSAYPPHPGYPSPYPMPYPAPSDGRDTAMWSHLGPLIAMFVGLSVLGWVIPLVLRGSAGQQVPFARDHATESLNFQLSTLLYGVVLLVVAVPFTILTFGLALLALIPLYLALFVFEVVVLIQASTAANRGQLYRYPLSIRFAR